MSAQAKEPRAPLADAGSELGHAFKAAMAAVRRVRSRETRCPGELSDAKYGLLFGLRGQAAMPLRELADLADLSPATATEMLESMEAAGLVQRVRAEHDRRVVLTSLTDHGRELVEARHRRYEPRWRAALGQFSEDDLRTAAAVLDRLRAMFDEMAAERSAGPERLSRSA